MTSRFFCAHLSPSRKPVTYLHDLRATFAVGDEVPSGAGAHVAVIDGGVDVSHPALANVAYDHQLSGNIISGDHNVTDLTSHGTSLAGIIAGHNDRFRGLAPHVRLTVLKADRDGEFYDEDIITALDRIVLARPHLVTIPLHENPHQETPPQSPPWHWSADSILERAIERIASRGILCILAAGNLGPSEGTVCRPGGSNAVITVGAVVRSGSLLKASSRGPYRVNERLPRGAVQQWGGEDVEERAKPDILALGSEIWGPQCSFMRRESAALPKSPLSDENYYRQVQGTSYAVAVVAGLAALAIETLQENLEVYRDNRGRVLKALLLLASHRGAKSGDAEAEVLRWPDVQWMCDTFVRDPDTKRRVLHVAGV